MASSERNLHPPRVGTRPSYRAARAGTLPLTSGTTVVNGLGDLEFTFTPPDDAAFFRLQSR